MNARELLRRYLEQRRELGEREFVLDSLTVEEAMRALGAVAAEEQPTKPLPVPRGAISQRHHHDGRDEVDWRAQLRAAGAAPKTAEPPAANDAPAGIVLGSASSELFGGPLADVKTLEELAERVAACRACSLFETARNPVPGVGNPNADFVCVGEAPGEQEDAQGEPFVGQAGQLLTKILAAIELRREDVFICNVLKHRPPGNRNPAPDEVAACKPFLLRQLELLKPKVILALGTFAAQTLLETRLAIGKLRGQIHTFRGIPLVVTYHPAALLRNPAWKRPTLDDVRFARRLLDRARNGA